MQSMVPIQQSILSMCFSLIASLTSAKLSHVEQAYLSPAWKNQIFGIFIAYLKKRVSDNQGIDSLSFALLCRRLGGLKNYFFFLNDVPLYI